MSGNEPVDGAPAPAHRDEPPAGPLGWLKSTVRLPNEDPRKIVFVAVSLCLVCSVLVSGAAVALRPQQAENKALDRKKNILAVAGLLEGSAGVDEAFARIEPRVVDLATGEFTDAVKPGAYDQRKAAKDPAMNVVVPRERDVAGVGTRARYAEVYLVRDGDRIDQIILPVHGYGLWSTLYGFLSLEGDFNTVAGLKFYEHAETPGLGGEVDNPAWQAHWPGKKVYGDDGRVRLEVVKGAVDPAGAQAEYRVDGLSGATLTSRGVTNTIRYWLGDEGFGPFLRKLEKG